MSQNLHFDKKCARKVGNYLEIDWKKIDFHEFYMGINVELEHGTMFGYKTNVTNDDPVTTGRIALAHLYEIPDYYRRLKIMEENAEKGKKY